MPEEEYPHVNPGTGLPNISPSYFPAFRVKMPPPPIGQGNWRYAPIVFSIQTTPTVRVPPFEIPPGPTPPDVDEPGEEETEAEFMLRCVTEHLQEGIHYTDAVKNCEKIWEDSREEEVDEHSAPAPMSAAQATRTPPPKHRRRKK